MESYPSKEVENLREKLVEENFYLITEAIMAGYFKTLFHLNPGGIQPHPPATCDRESLLRPHEFMLYVALDYGTMAHQRSSLCPPMSSPPSAMGSKGSKSGAWSRCAGCQCSGFKVQIRQLGPGMIQQMQHPCNECKGSGETISDKDRCPQCKGDKVVSEKKVFEVVVEKGMQNGHKITFPGEADEAPDTATGDIIFVLQQKEHPKQMLIKLNHGEVVKPDSFKAINDEGMPMYQRPFMKGKLYIHFSVEFSDSLSPEQCKALEVVLPPKPVSQYTDMELDECEDTMAYDVNIEEEMRRRQQQHQEAYDEDDNVPGGGQRV
ncbi:DnaJ 2 [Zea mays]|uniref:DnaJ 2 n=1 Tax=Zea mays TaxID=4577 RepID=A0A3L6FV28_MAIZE|nr:DnaJ 2 [Zea mays]